jgi:integrase
MPQWVKNAIDRWTASAGIASGPIFRPVNKAGGELEQIQFLLGHISVQTTERYLGCKQRFRNAVNDRPGIEPELPAG